MLTIEEGPLEITKEIAYFIGLAQTDGSMYRGKGGKGKFSLELSSRDGEIMHSLRLVLPKNYLYERTRTTNFGSDYKSIVLCVFSAEFREWLSEFVPYGHKSSIIEPLQTIYENDYVRGLIDGDGSLGFTKFNYPFVSLNRTLLPQ